MPFDLQPTLRGKLVVAAPLRESDYADLYSVASDPLLWEQHPQPDRYTEPVFAAFFKEAIASGGALLVRDAVTGEVIGTSRFAHHDEAARSIEIGWTFLARSRWGGRYNGELKALMLAHAFRFVERVLFAVGPRNVRSQRALGKIGAVRIAWRDADTGRERCVFELTAEAFAQRQAQGGNTMSKVRVACFAISLDGYGAGPNQSLEHPLGMGGEELHRWLLPTRTFQRKVLGRDGGTTGADDAFAARGFDNVGAWILGRNMFGPVRGPWPDFEWKGWWGDEPPYGCPVFVLTHHARPLLPMAGGTTFEFVTGGIDEALARARAAAGGKDVRIGGGPSVIRQYLRAGAIDELHFAIAPALLGSGEPLFRDVNLRALGYTCTERVATDGATHVVLTRSAARGR